ncbi:MAG: hypothetical protein MJY45_04140 [Bacteroidales bacterium]|nr:hypothetical protein [Bacteroidales bacterium]
MNENETRIPENREDTIDYKAIALRLWAKRKFILRLWGAFVTIGFFAALFQRPVYVSSCTFVPLSSSSKTSSSLSSLAALAGVSMGDMTNGESLSPLIYPQLLDNVDFNRELMRIPLHFKRYDEPVSLYDLSTDPKYRRFTLGTIKKYTLGLPRVILGAIRGSGPDVILPEDVKDSARISAYTKEEFKVYKAVSKMLSMTVERKDGYLTLSARSSEALVAAELCQGAMDLMQKYVADFRLEQARDNLSYLQARADEARAEYLTKQLELAQYTDSNRGAPTATSMTRREQLTSEYEIAFALYTEVSKQLLKAELKVKNDTPVLSAVKPVSVPMLKSNSRTKTWMVWIFMGLVISCGLVIGIDYLRDKGLKWPADWD